MERLQSISGFLTVNVSDQRRPAFEAGCFCYGQEKQWTDMLFFWFSPFYGIEKEQMFEYTKNNHSTKFDIKGRKSHVYR